MEVLTTTLSPSAAPAETKKERQRLTGSVDCAEEELSVITGGSVR